MTHAKTFNFHVFTDTFASFKFRNPQSSRSNALSFCGATLFGIIRIPHIIINPWTCIFGRTKKYNSSSENSSYWSNHHFAWATKANLESCIFLDTKWDMEHLVENATLKCDSQCVNMKALANRRHFSHLIIDKVFQIAVTKQDANFIIIQCRACAGNASARKTKESA